MNDHPTPASAYVHVPFCRHRCGYCNFSVVAGREDLIDRYLRAVERELADLVPTSDGSPKLTSLFIGGGTPTHFDVPQLERFLAILHRRFAIDSSTEWTMEANPEDISEDKLAILAEHGVSRMSLGVQSFNDSKLKILERSHTGALARDVIRKVAEVIPNVSIDLIFAAPGETPQSWRKDVESASELPIHHVSTYALTFEKGTSFWTRLNQGDLQAADEIHEVQMYDDARELLESAGLSHYEISSFARPGHRCRHNMAYWRGDPWYAAGPGAAAFVSHVRTLNHRSTTTYLKRMENGQSPIVESEEISAEQRAREKAGFGIRMIDGVDLEAIRGQTNVDIAKLCDKEIEELNDQGLIDRRGSHLRLTKRGVHFADTVASEFFGE